MTDAPEHIRLVPLTDAELEMVLDALSDLNEFGPDEQLEKLQARLEIIRANPNNLLETPARDGQSMRAWK